MQSFRSSSYEVRQSQIHGLGGYATLPIAAGELVAVRSGSVVPYEEARRRDAAIGGFSMHVEPGLFLCPDSGDQLSDIAVYLNHSCDPNTGIKGQISFVALNDIEPGEELTFDYATNVSCPYRLACQCGSALCRKIVTGDDWRLPALQERYAGHFDAVITGFLGSRGNLGGSFGESVIPSPVPLEGPVFNRIVAALSGMPTFDAWRSGLIARDTYCNMLDRILELPTTVPLNENERALSARLWWRPADCIGPVLEKLHQRGALIGRDYDVQSLSRCLSIIDRHWFHGGNSTYIFHEEASLAFILARARKPRHMAVIGSYYGYWAAFAILGAFDSLERAVLVDLDPAYCELARKNLARLGLQDRVDVLALDGIEFLETTSTVFDFVLLDPEGPRDEGPWDRRGKAVYGPVLRALEPALSSDALMLAHNILINCDTGLPYFDQLTARNREELGPFLDLAGSVFDSGQLVIDTTEGVGVYWR